MRRYLDNTELPGPHSLLELGAASSSPPPVKREPPEHKALLHNILSQHPHMATPVHVALLTRTTPCTTSTTGSLPPSPADSGVSDVDSSSSGHTSNDELKARLQPTPVPTARTPDSPGPGHHGDLSEMCMSLLVFVVSLNILFSSAWTRSVDSIPKDHFVDPSAVVFPSSLSSPFHLPNRVLNSDGNEVFQHEYLHAVEALFAVTTRLKALLGRDHTKNVLVSPISTTTALGEILLGARGDSRRQLLDMLSTVNRTSGTAEATVVEFHQQIGGLIKLFQNSPDYDGSYQLELASAMFLNPHLHLHRDFLSAITDFYGVDIEPMDFNGDPVGTMNAINLWASRHTRGIIEKVFTEPLPRSTAVVLTNAIYFKGDWETPFNPRYTIPGKFRTNQTNEVDVEFMRGEFDLMYVDSARLRCRMIAIPYKHEKAAMYVMLPDSENPYDIQSFASSLSITDVRELITSTKPATVALLMPKMALTQSFSLKNVLTDFKRQVQVEHNGDTHRQKKLLSSQGIYDKKYEMSCNSSANLHLSPHRRIDKKNNTVVLEEDVGLFDMSGASPDHHFRVDDIIHNIFLEINEMGTVAAAVSASVVNKIGDSKNFQINRPFIFFIRHEVTGSPLFWGTIVDPTNSNRA